MDTPTIAKYYREKDPMERLKLLEQSIAAGEEPEENRIRKELWEIRYSDKAETGDTRAGGHPLEEFHQRLSRSLDDHGV